MKVRLLLILTIPLILSLNSKAQNLLNVRPVLIDTLSSENPEYGLLVFDTFIADSLVFESEAGIIVERSVRRDLTPIGDEKYTYSIIVKTDIVFDLKIKAGNSPDYNLNVQKLAPGASRAFFVEYNLSQSTVSASAGGSLSIMTDPAGVSLTISGESGFKETTPYIIKDRQQNSIKIRLEKTDFFSIDTTLSIVPGQTSEVFIKMKPRFLVTQNDTVLILQKEIRKHSKKKSFWFISTLISAGAGGYFMYQADQLYQEYLSSSDSHANELYDKVVLYDKIAPACFGFAGFCALEYTIQAAKKGKDKRQLKVYMSSRGARLTLNF